MGAWHGDTAANHMDLLSGCGRTCVFVLCLGTSFPLFHGPYDPKCSDNIDGALQYDNGYTYFFKRGLYYRFDDMKFKVLLIAHNEEDERIG